MVFDLPNGLFHDNWKAFNKWHDKHIIIDFIIGILGIIVTLVFSFVPHLTTVVLKHFWISLILLVLFFTIIIYKFFKWKINNFKKTDITIDSLLIIDYDNKSLTINVGNNIIIPSEDILMLKLTLTFDKDIIQDLKKIKKYEIIFDKPTNLEIEYVEQEHVNTNIIGNNKYDDQFKIQFDYRNNFSDTHVFKLESDFNTMGELKIFFRTGTNDNINKNGLFKDDPLFNKEILTTKIEHS